VLEHVGAVRLPPGRREPVVDLLLQLGVTLSAMCRNGEGVRSGSNRFWSSSWANWKNASALPSPRPKKVWQ
jgi:hypothetical protein